MEIIMVDSSNSMLFHVFKIPCRVRSIPNCALLLGESTPNMLESETKTNCHTVGTSMFPRPGMFDSIMAVSNINDDQTGSADPIVGADLHRQWSIECAQNCV